MPPELRSPRRSTLAGLAVILVVATAADPSGVAEELLAAGRIREARDVLERLHSDEPGQSEVTGRLARVRGWTGDYAGALELYDELLDDRPQGLDLRVERARVLVWMGRYGQAEDALQDLVFAHPDFGEAWTVLADARVRDGDVDGAREAVREGMAQAPRTASLYAWMATSDYRAGRVGDARDQLSLALSLEPGLPEGRRSLALYSPFVLESRFTYEDVFPLGPWRELDLSLAWRPRGAWEYRGEATRIDRFGSEEVSVAGSVARTIGSRGRLEGTIHGAPGAQVLPEWGASVDGAWSPSARWRLETGVHRDAYRSGATVRLDAGLARGWGSVWETGYRVSWTRDVEGATDVTHVVRGSWAPSAFTAVHLDFFRGSDVTRSPVAADVRTTTTTGLALVGRYDLAGGWGLSLSVAVTDRSRSYQRQTLGFGLVRHF